MTITKGEIVLESIRFYSLIGVMDEEREVGAWFTVSLRIETDLSRAMATDDMNDSISYADIYTEVQDIMKKPCCLLERKASEILEALYGRFSAIEGICISLRKDNPPMGADLAGCSVVIETRR